METKETEFLPYIIYNINSRQITGLMLKMKL